MGMLREKTGPLWIQPDFLKIHGRLHEKYGFEITREMSDQECTGGLRIPEAD